MWKGKSVFRFRLLCQNWFKMKQCATRWTEQFHFLKPNCGSGLSVSPFQFLNSPFVFYCVLESLRTFYVTGIKYPWNFLNCALYSLSKVDVVCVPVCVCVFCCTCYILSRKILILLVKWERFYGRVSILAGTYSSKGLFEGSDFFSGLG